MAKKLFQHIASEKELQTQCNVIEAETKKVFSGGDLFQGMVKTFVPLVEGIPVLPGERKEVVTTVMKRLRYHATFAAKMFDYELTRDAANQRARADVIVDGATMFKDAPVTWLLSTETRLRALREILAIMPTLDLSKFWEAVGDEIFKHGPTFTNREVKVTSAVVLYPHTEHHPAQIEKVTTPKVESKFEVTITSGAVHPGKKAGILEWTDKLIAAFKDARLRANELPVEEQSAGAKIFEYILSAPQKE